MECFKIISNLIKEHKKQVIILILLLLGYTYFIHEPIHKFTADYFSYENKINLLKFPPQVDLDLTNISNLNHMFFLAINPYLFGLLILFILFLVSFFVKNEKIILFSLIPLLDLLINLMVLPLALILKMNNDFLILFRYGFFREVLLIFLCQLILFCCIIKWSDRIKENA